MTGVLRRMYAALDGPDPQRSLELLSPSLRFCILFSVADGQAEDFAGGRAEFDAYMAQRDAPTWVHHVLTESSQGDLEVVLGETRRDGVQVASFVAAAGVDAGGLIDRYLVGRSPAVLFG